FSLVERIEQFFPHTELNFIKRRAKSAEDSGETFTYASVVRKDPSYDWFENTSLLTKYVRGGLLGAVIGNIAARYFGMDIFDLTLVSGYLGTQADAIQYALKIDALAKEYLKKADLIW
ncbi:MAG: hypothetical protein AABX51_06310, partial [Nanoarchaeota archaeon]